MLSLGVCFHVLFLFVHRLATSASVCGRQTAVGRDSFNTHSDLAFQTAAADEEPLMSHLTRLLF